MKGKIFVSLFALPFFGVGVWMLWSVSSSLVESWQMNGWVQTEAQLTRGGYETHSGDDSNTYEAFADYTYNFQGTSYSGDRVSLSSGADNIGDYQTDIGSNLRNVHASGEPIFVYIDPDNPATLRNFFFVGVIRLILPNAKIIYCHRNPVDTCLSCYSRYFANGQKFSNDLTNLGRFYQLSRRLMAHWQMLFPDEILEVQYEDVVADTETQIKRILDHCGLPFEEACLQFHQTERAVRTASSEQVRQPIYSGALEHWRNYEEHLDVLKENLGPVLDRYPID